MSYSLAYSQAIFIILYIASMAERGVYDFTPTPKISHELTIPPSTAAMILRRLSRAGLIETREGVNGGVRLAIPPDEVTLLDVFKAIEQERPMFQTDVQIRKTGDKSTRVQNTVVERLQSAEDAMKQSLGATTIRDLMNGVYP